jgi:hypothetical protein
MWRSERERLRGRSSLRCAVLVAACLCTAAPGTAETIHVRTSTFNKFIARIEPIPFSGRYRFRVTIDTFIFGKHVVTLCDSPYRGTVNGLRFVIVPGVVQVTGRAGFTWCNLGFDGAVTGTGRVYYNNGDDTVRLAFSSAAVRPSFKFLGFNVTLPVTVNIAPTLDIPPLPIRPALIGLRTPDGARYLRMTPANTTVSAQAGYVELKSEVRFR